MCVLVLFKSCVATGIYFEVADFHAVEVIFAEQDAASYIFKSGIAIFIFIYEFFDITPAMRRILDDVESIVAHAVIIAVLGTWCLIGI